MTPAEREAVDNTVTDMTRWREVCPWMALHYPNAPVLWSLQRYAQPGDFRKKPKPTQTVEHDERPPRERTREERQAEALRLCRTVLYGAFIRTPEAWRDAEAVLRAYMDATGPDELYRRIKRLVDTPEERKRLKADPTKALAELLAVTGTTTTNDQGEEIAS